MTHDVIETSYFIGEHEQLSRRRDARDQAMDSLAIAIERQGKTIGQFDWASSANPCDGGVMYTIVATPKAT